MESPAAIRLAPVPSRLTGPEVRERVPLAIVWLVLVELVKVANVPSPAIAAAAPRTAIVAITLFVVAPGVRIRSRITRLLSAVACPRPSPERGRRAQSR